MNLAQRLNLLEIGLRPIKVDVVEVEPYQSQTEALEQYEKNNNKKTIPGQRIIYIMILPDTCDSDYLYFQNKNDEAIKKLWNNNMSLNNISNKYFVDRNSIIEV